jgi:virginiamycin B lyase
MRATTRWLLVALTVGTVCGCLASSAAAAVYWANVSANTIGEANLDGTGVNQSFITGANGPGDVVVYGQHLYWSNSGSNTIGRAKLNGSDVDQDFITRADSPNGVVVNGQSIYWANSGSNTVGRANLDGSDVDQSFVTGADDPEGMAIDGSDIYWANHNDGRIGRATLAGGDIDQSFIPDAGSFPTRVTVAAGHIYWTTWPDNSVPTAGTIGRANLDGTDVDSNLIQSPDTPVGVAVASVSAPAADRTVDAAPVSGSVLIELPHTHRFVRLRIGQAIPVGSTVNATRGTVEITSATNHAGHTGTGRFYDGTFRITQSGPAAGLITDLTLAGPKPAGCAAPSGDTATATRRRPHSRRLWGDAHGNFSTVGSYASATERGTEWLTEDTCAGTLIRVTQGAVTIHDFPRHRSFVLKAPHSFTAHPGKGG